jgi:hypothetical protein
MKTGRLREIELRELGGDGVEPLHRAAVVVLVVADQDLSERPLIALGSKDIGLMS